MDILDAPTKSAKAKTMADVWFEQDIFKQALDEDNNDEEFELERKLTALKSDGVTVLGKSSKNTVKTNQDYDDDDDDDDSTDSENERKPKKSKRALKDDEFEEVPVDQRMLKTTICDFNFRLFPFFLAMKRIHLDADELALGHMMAQSKKNREHLVDHSYNR